MSGPSIIAIDGPSASGKSSVGHLLAERLGYRFLDTGAMYRTIAWLALRRQIDLEDEDALAKLAASAEIELRAPSVADGRPYSVLVDGQDVTWQIRESAVDSIVPQVAALPKVRAALVEKQHTMAKDGNLVVEGRDIGTVVFPQAELKVYLMASVEERAHRRQLQLRERGEEAQYDSILTDLKWRDKMDTERLVSPLQPALGARIISSDGRPMEDILTEILTIIEKCKRWRRRQL